MGHPDIQDMGHQDGIWDPKPFHAMSSSRPLASVSMHNRSGNSLPDARAHQTRTCSTPIKQSPSPGAGRAVAFRERPSTKSRKAVLLSVWQRPAPRTASRTAVATNTFGSLRRSLQESQGKAFVTVEVSVHRHRWFRPFKQPTLDFCGTDFFISRT
jgi:hypothetical protein